LDSERNNGEIIGRMMKEAIETTDRSVRMEPRFTLTGERMRTAFDLASFINRQEILNDRIRGAIQIPRRFKNLFDEGRIENFRMLYQNILLPLFQASHDPEGYPEMAKFLG
jgi:hypothetical protein